MMSRGSFLIVIIIVVINVICRIANMQVMNVWSLIQLVKLAIKLNINTVAKDAINVNSANRSGAHSSHVDSFDLFIFCCPVVFVVFILSQFDRQIKSLYQLGRPFG